jgi:hypothetical protein
MNAIQFYYLFKELKNLGHNDFDCGYQAALVDIGYDKTKLDQDTIDIIDSDEFIKRGT